MTDDEKAAEMKKRTFQHVMQLKERWNRLTLDARGIAGEIFRIKNDCQPHAWGNPIKGENPDCGWKRVCERCTAEQCTASTNPDGTPKFPD